MLSTLNHIVYRIFSLSYIYSIYPSSVKNKNKKYTYKYKGRFESLNHNTSRRCWVFGFTLKIRKDIPKQNQVLISYVIVSMTSYINKLEFK